MKKTLLLFLLFACVHFANAQNTQAKLAQLVNSLSNLKSKLPVEKVHLHIDKPFYAVGDTIWIKAYVTGQEHHLSALSKVVHVELINSDDSIITSMAMPVTAGQAWGAITLADTLFSADNYNLRAYTNLMRNYDNSYFYNRSLSIGDALPQMGENNVSNPKISTIPASINGITKKPENISLEFFPEGGTLISNIISTVAFKATGEDGLSRNVNGYIIDKNNNRVAAFASEHAGMGTFKLFASADNAYTAIFTINGVEKRVPLPPAQKEGYSISASQDKENLFIKIITSVNSTDTLNLIAQANNEVLYSGKASLSNQGLITVISKKRFPNGILQLTLFNRDFLPVAERLVFIKQDAPYLQINLTDTIAGKQKSGTVRFSFNAADKAGKPVTGSFSMAVTNADKVIYNEDSETSILSNLLLTSDLRGYVEQPNYYFTDTLAVKNKHLDNLMLTQGWRRFVWTDVLAGSYKPAIFNPERDNITGSVSDNKKQPVAGAHIALFIKNGAMLVIDTLTDMNGRFVFTNILPDKGDDYVITATDARGKVKFNVELDKPESSAAPEVVYQPAFPYEGFDKYLESARKDYEDLMKKGLLNTDDNLLNEVTITEKTKRPVVEVAVKHSANLRGGGVADKVITFIDLLPCRATNDLSGCLIGKLNNIRFFDGKAFSRGSLHPMAIYVNGGYTEAGYDGAISEIASIEVLNTARSAIYGPVGANGILLITTKTGDVDYFAYEQAHLRGKLPPRQALSSTVFAPRREFYVPRYMVKQDVTDLRSTVYWKPDILTDDKGSAIIEFFKGKPGENYRIIIEGIDTDGRLGRKVFTYIVK